MSWKFPDDDDVIAAERQVYRSRDAVRWRYTLVAARARRTLRSKTVLFIAGLAGFALPTVMRSGVGKRLLALAPILRWVSPVMRILKV